MKKTLFVFSFSLYLASSVLAQTQNPSTAEPVNQAPVFDIVSVPKATPTVASQSPVQPAIQSPKDTSIVTTQSDKPSEDLWDRIRRGFAMPDLQTDLVTNREQWYATRPDYIERMTARSSKYLFHVVEELEARKMPTELALLPFIESAFNPQAVSSAKAAGMWQFIPSTGRYYALKQNIFRDERRDVQASTRAALDYLSKLYAQFGDWHLALAAYNWGEGSVARAISRNQKLGLSTGYLDLKMPNETQYYVPKLQAVKNIIANPSQFNAILPSIPNHPYFLSVPISRDIDVALAAKLANVPLGDFKALNPSQSRPVIMAAGTPQVLLPWDNASVFQSNLNNYTGQLASWTAWVIPTALKLKDAAKRTGMSEGTLRNVNLIPPKAIIVKAGSTLLIPRSTHIQEDVTAYVADNGQLQTQEAAKKKRAAKKGIKADRKGAANSASKAKVGKRAAHKKAASHKSPDKKK